jgi:uncharacterized protein
MKIDLRNIPQEGLFLEEFISPGELDVETDIVKFEGPLRVRAKVSRITNAVDVQVNIQAVTCMFCSRCLKEFKGDFNKDITLHYSVSSRDHGIALNDDIREELILDYPIKPLCNPECKGLCSKCGNNIDEGGCTCAITKEKTF